jgi:hypothetical protein
MLISGEITCSKCNNIIEWEYLVPQRLSSRTLQVDKLDKSKVRPTKLSKTDTNEYTFECRCKKCDALNRFTYYTELRL